MLETNVLYFFIQKFEAFKKSTNSLVFRLRWYFYYLQEIFALLILTVAAAESSIGLAILVVYYRIRSVITVESMSLTKG